MKRESSYKRGASAAALGLAVCVAALLSACGGSSDSASGGGSGDGGGNGGGAVTASAPGSPVVGVVGKPTTVPVQFVANQGSVSNLTIDASSLPAGWSVAAPDTCPSITAGAACTLDLSYAPGAVASAPQSLSLNYHYADSQGGAQSDQTTLQYSARMAFVYVTQVTTAPVSGGTEAPGSIVRCSMNPDGSLANCGDSGAAGLGAPLRAVFNGNDAYIADVEGGLLTGAQTTGKILHCSADPASGALSGCADTGATNLVAPSDIAINGNLAYIVDGQQGKVTRCQISSPTSFTACTALALPPDAAEPLTDAINGNFLYVGGHGFKGYACPLASDGSLGNCAAAYSAASFGDITALAFDGGRLYAAGVPTGNLSGLVAQCTVNAGDGTLDACSPTPTAGQPGGLAIVDGSAYLSNAVGSQLVQCPVAPDGSIGSCANLPSSPPLDFGFGVSVY